MTLGAWLISLIIAKQGRRIKFAWSYLRRILTSIKDLVSQDKASFSKTSLFSNLTIWVCSLNNLLEFRWVTVTSPPAFVKKVWAWCVICCVNTRLVKSSLTSRLPRTQFCPKTFTMLSVLKSFGLVRPPTPWLKISCLIVPLRLRTWIQDELRSSASLISSEFYWLGV